VTNGLGAPTIDFGVIVEVTEENVKDAAVVVEGTGLKAEVVGFLDTDDDPKVGLALKPKDAKISSSSFGFCFGATGAVNFGAKDVMGVGMGRELKSGAVLLI